MVASSSQGVSRSDINIQSVAFDAGEKINAYITAEDATQAKIGNPEYDDRRTVYTTGKADANGINSMTPDEQPYFLAGNVPVSVYALYPSSVTSSSDSFTVEEEQTDSQQYKNSDLMYAFASGQSKATGTVNLHFTHMMAKLIINITGQDGIVPGDIVLKHLHRSVGITPGSSELGALGETDDFIKLPNGGAVLFPPQAISPNADGVIEVATNKDKPVLFTLQNAKNFRGGKQYVLNLAVGQQNLDATTPVVIPEWSDDAGTLSVAAVGSQGMMIVGDSAIVRNANGKITSSRISHYVYDKEKNPRPSEDGKMYVLYGEERLTEGEHYTLQYFNDDRAGQATVVAIGRDKYEGAAAVMPFNIDKASSPMRYPQTEMTLDFVYNGKVDNDLINEVSEATVSYSYTSTPNNVVTVNTTTGEVRMQTGGTARITATRPESNNYYGATASYSLTVNQKDLSDASIDVEITNGPFVYNGKAFTGNATSPNKVEFVVKDKGTPLTNGEYTAAYGTNTNAGKNAGSITLTGVNNKGYRGTRTVYFDIEKATPSQAISTDEVILDINKSTNRPLTTNSPGTKSYISKNTAIATVDNNGKITGIARGSTTIEVSVSETTNYRAIEPISIKVTVSAQSLWQYNWNGTTGTNNGQTTYNSGSEQKWICDQTGIYKLEVWGAHGGDYLINGAVSTSGNGYGGAGGYAYGHKRITVGTTLYIYVGGQGTSCKNAISSQVNFPGGYNGGGNGGHAGTTSVYQGPSGGGATHIATATGLLSALSSNQPAVLIVAGGGGGGTASGTTGGNGGGEEGAPGHIIQETDAEASTWATSLLGGNQSGPTSRSDGGGFGRGGNGYSGSFSGSQGNRNIRGSGGGGGGWYGGMGWQRQIAAGASGAGGSGYIGGVDAPKGWGDDDDTSSAQTARGEWTDYNGHARITLVSTE